MIVPTLDALMRVLIVTPLVYLAAVALLRVSGKRSLAKLNAFDLIVTVAATLWDPEVEIRHV